MKNNYSKKLLSSVLLATSLSAVSVNNKIANAAFESYKRDERDCLNNFVTDINKDDLKASYSSLLWNLVKIVQNRSKVNSLLKDSILSQGLNESKLSNEILRLYGAEFQSKGNLELMKEFINKITNLRGGHCTVWSQSVINAVNNLSNRINEELKENDSNNIEKVDNNSNKINNNSSNINIEKKIDNSSKLDVELKKNEKKQQKEAFKQAKEAFKQAMENHEIIIEFEHTRHFVNLTEEGFDEFKKCIQSIDFTKGGAECELESFFECLGHDWSYTGVTYQFGGKIFLHKSVLNKLKERKNIVTILNIGGNRFAVEPKN